MKKSFILFVILILVFSCLIATNTVFAQVISKPSVPVYTTKYADFSYDVPTTYGIDQSTGKNVTLQAGYHVENRTIEFNLKNQLFTAYNDSNGKLINLYYNFRAKEHNGNEWVLHPFAQTGPGTWQSTYTNSEFQQTVSRTYPTSNAENTDVTINLDFFSLQNVPIANQVDLQVQALTGHVDPINSGPIAGMGYYSFTGESSDWSNTQTITIGNQTTSPPFSSSTSPTPSVQEFPASIVIIIFIVTLTLLGTIVNKRKHFM